MSTSYNIASQICGLLNKENDLLVKYTPKKIISSDTRYIWIYGSEGIDGVIGLERNNYLMSRLKHLSVQPSLRRKGIGSKLVNYALSKVDTKFSYCTIKETNQPSLNLFLKAGFSIVSKYYTEHGNVLLLIRTAN